MTQASPKFKRDAASRAGGLRKRSVSLAGHATSLALEPEFWAVLEVLAQARGVSLAGLIAEIDAGRDARPLASACRVAALAFSRAGQPNP
jgi:predicted DNA-binding ribbon-helix-helix protein